MSGVEVYIVVSFSLVLGAILGALLYNCVRGARSPGPVLAPVKPASPSRAALCAAVTGDSPVSSNEPPNMAAWRRLDAPRAFAHLVARRPHPAEAEVVAPLLRRTCGTRRLGAIDAQTAQDNLPSHFGTSLAPLPRPAANAGQTGKLIRMPAARAATPVHIKPHSRAS